MNQTLLVNKTDFGDVVPVNIDEAPLAEDHIRVRIGPFALTANNITYMVTGDRMGYWKFFEPSEYGIDRPGAGRIPVWGFAEVTESRVGNISVGERIYGFFPVAEMLDIKPTRLSRHSFHDGASHRIPLHPVYNTYVRTQNDPGFDGDLDDLQPVLRPLFTTSFLIDDRFDENRFYGADQILILSASSKTALGTAFCMKQRGAAKITGLTSARNKAFVESTGFYDHVVTYEHIHTLDGGEKSAVVDMAGSGEITGRVYDHFGENIVYNCMVGKSHRQGGKPPKINAGAPPVMFFAPDRARERIGEWGRDGFADRLGAQWIPFCQSAKDWLDINKSQGIEKLLPVYQAFLEGTVPAAKACLFSLQENHP
ncbi:MAG: DUF2855 family protein [Hyphomonadaceae bacterium]|nr:DUF2855 family protein [Hyphomonadaceae bacterium]